MYFHVILDVLKCCRTLPKNDRVVNLVGALIDDDCNTSGSNAVVLFIMPRYPRDLHAALKVQYTSVKIIKNEVRCRDDTVPKTVDTRKHCKIGLRACNNLPKPRKTKM